MLAWVGSLTLRVLLKYLLLRDPIDSIHNFKLSFPGLTSFLLPYLIFLHSSYHSLTYIYFTHFLLPAFLLLNKAYEVRVFINNSFLVSCLREEKHKTWKTLLVSQSKFRWRGAGTQEEGRALGHTTWATAVGKSVSIWSKGKLVGPR